MKTELLEYQVRRDMLVNGFNPLDPVDIKLYWEWKLS